MTDDKTRVLPQTQVPDPQRPRQARKRRRRRMSRGQRFILTVLTLLVLFAALAVGAVFLAEFQMDDLGTFDSLASGEGTYLVVGTDSRENLPDDLEGKFGDFAGARADVIMLMQVASDEVQLLSIPRDLRVEIPGHGVNKVNAAYAFGGPELLVETVSRETGIRINHYLEVDFGGFAGIVDALGGIELDFPAPARDLKSGLEVEEAGTQVVDGATALAYARSRSYEELRDGEWQSTGGGDIARTGRQREVLLEIIDRASSPGGIIRSPLVLQQVTANLRGDSTVTPLRLLKTAWRFRSADETKAITLPVVGHNEGGVSYVVRDEPAATAVLEAFAAGDPLPED
ncbi:MAG: LCP family protein [Actinomycetes bacterium]|jgi:LCP family protein required for cell wall assembly|nr:LytR family transcriptional regulator [Acidimicrobiia bacterium]